MTNPLTTSYKNALDDDVTQPYYLVEIGWDSPAYYSTIGDITWLVSWLSAPLEVSHGTRPKLVFFNADLTFGQLVLAQGTAGRTVRIFQGYQNDASHPNPIEIFNGELGEADIGEFVTIECKRYPPVKTPRHFCTQPTFNHLPKAGTRFDTPSGTIILESR